MLRKSMDEMGGLLPAHITQAEYEKIYGPKGRRGEARLLEVERSRRIAALEATLKGKPMNQQPSKALLGIDQALTLIKNTTTPELIERIIDRLDADGHLRLVEADIPQAIKDMAIDRILAA
jgi:hypothetical protein